MCEVPESPPLCEVPDSNPKTNSFPFVQIKY